MPLTEEVPKPLMEVAGSSLLERLITVCAGAGFEEVIVVVGHHAGVVDRWLASTPQPLPVRTVLNDCYDTINNGHSLLVAREAVADRHMVKFDGDLVLKPAVLERLLTCPFPTALACDTAVALAEEEMKVLLDGEGRVTSMGKWLDPARSHGESIGVEKIAAGQTARLFDALQEEVHGKGRHEAYYEDIYHTLMQEGWEMGGCDIAGLRWCEVDDHEDLAQASRIFAGEEA
jgi:choline kinase